MSEVRAHDCYVSHKVNTLRWLGDSDCFVTGSWDERIYTQWKWGNENKPQGNKLCFWKLGLDHSSSLDLPECTGTILHNGDVMDMAYMHGPGYGRIITASSTGEVTAFFQEENGNIKSFGLEKGHNGPATVVEVVRDQSSDSVVSAGEDGKVILYSLKEQKMIDSWKCGRSITSINLQGDANQVFTSNTSGNLRFWDTRESKKAQTKVRCDGSGAIHSIDIHPSRPLLVATGNEDGSICIWD